MSGTPSTSEPYAVLGTPFLTAPEGTDPRFGLVVLTRTAWIFRAQVLTEWHAAGFAEILCMEDSAPRYDAESLTRMLPGLRILVFHNPTSPGARINAAAREIRCERFLVLWDDQALPDAVLSARLLRLWAESRVVALVPEFRDAQDREVPSVMVPGLEKQRLKILALGAEQDNVETLFPADYTALYDRERFLRTGGFDAQMTSPFWQKVDWGFRSRLWGERLSVHRGFKISYRSSPPVEDQTADRSYHRFFLRNLSIRHAGDHAVLPWRRFWTYARGAGISWLRCFGLFREQRRWVHTNRYRFQTDARLLLELWGGHP